MSFFKSFKQSALISLHRNLSTKSFERFPVQTLYNDSTILNKNKSLTKVIKLSGIDYNGLSENRLLDLKSARHSAFKTDDKFVLSSYALKFKQKPKIKLSEYPNPVSQQLNNTWASSFDNLFLTDHYLAVTTDFDLINTAGNFLSSLTKKTSNASSLEIPLMNQVKLICGSLVDYSPVVLSGSELVGFLSSLVNAEKVDQIKPLNDLFENWIISSPIRITPFKNYIEYLSSGKIASFLTIRNFDDLILQNMFDVLVQTNIEMIITQHFKSINQQAAITTVKKRERGLSDSDSEDMKKEISDLLGNLTAYNTTACIHNLSIQIISDNLTQHLDNISRIKALFSVNEYKVETESLNRDPLYYSQFPTLRKANYRRYLVTLHNIVDFVSFSSCGSGHSTCSFGPEPVTHFSTEDGNIYRLIFQSDEKKLSPGHMLIIGKTGLGKTTLISFLLSAALKYKNIKIFGFDQLSGLKVSTLMQYGNYIDFSNVAVNPLSLNDTTQNRSFLIKFLSDIFSVTDSERLIIEDKIPQIFKWELRNRNLEMIPHLLTNEDSELFKKIKTWLKGGAYDGYFNAKENSFDLNNPLTFFDFTHILDDPKLLGPIASYLKQLFFSTADGSPRIIFNDEYAAFLRSPVYAELSMLFLDQFRKLNGVFIAALQSIDQMWETEVGKKSIGAFSKCLLYPVKSRLNYEAYTEGLGLNDSEIAWLKNTNPQNRQVMLKIIGGESTILNADLQYLNKYMRVLDSSAGAVKKLDSFRRNNPEDFRDAYLNA